MKKLNILALSLFLTMSYLGHSQCDNQLLNGDGETNSFNYPGWCNNGVLFTGTQVNYYVDNWFASHGHPELKVGGPSSCNHYFYMFNLNSQNKEGLYYEYIFLQGETYTISYEVNWKNGGDPNSVLKMQLANALIPTDAYSSVSDPYPPSLDYTNINPLITDEQYSSPGQWTTVTKTFTVPMGGATQIAFYPYQANGSSGKAEVLLDDLCIIRENVCEITPTFFSPKSFNFCTRNFTNTTFIPSNLSNFQILQTTWDFGDGVTAVGDKVNHIYQTPGSYYACMTIWISDGYVTCKLNVCKQINILKVNEYCTVDACGNLDMGNINFTTSGASNISFYPKGTGILTNSNYGYYWDFGDGTYGNSDSGLNGFTRHQYTQPGDYVVCLTVYFPVPGSYSWSDCCSNSYCTTITID